MSQKGEHFQKGEGSFGEGENIVFGTSDTGDMAIFRFDMVHGVTPVDAPSDAGRWDSDRGVWTDASGQPGESIAWEKSDGRWVAVLSVQY
jgi:hypothetical protein